MELIETARGHLKVRDGDHTATIYGEAFLRGYGSPDFLAYSNSIDKWDPPNEQEKIPYATKEQLLQFLRKEFVRKKMILEIE